MKKDKWIIILVSLVTLSIFFVTIYFFIGEKGDTEKFNKSEESLSKEYEKETKEREKNDLNDNMGSKEVEKAEEKARTLENILEIESNSIVSKEKLEKEIEKWDKEGVIEGNEDSQGIAEKIKEKYGDIAIESYLSSQLVSLEMGGDELQQLAIGFSKNEIKGKKVYYDIKPYEVIKNRLKGGIERDPQIIIGGDTDNEDDIAKYYYKNTEGFEDVKGNEVGYYELVFYDDTENTIKLFGDLGAEHEEIGDLLGFNIVYHMKLDEEYSEEEIKDKISEIEINGNTGERMFELLSSQDEYIYPKDSILKVNVPVTSEDLFGEKDDLQARSKWSKGKTDEPEIEINGEKVKLKGHTKEEYLEGVTVEK